MKKSISFSVYGSKPMYTVGMLKNIELAKTIYPEWTIEIYYNSSVPFEYIEKYKQHNVNLYDMTNSHVPGMFWRFLSKAEIFISRDTDSRLNLREKAAVDEWLASGKAFHVMRDHPAHQIPILGGMWGVRKSTLGADIEGTINQWLSKNPDSWGYGIDQIFLNNLYNFYKSQNQILIHDSLGIHRGDKGIPFPTPHGPDYRFVGEIFDENDVCRPDHHQNWLDAAPYERRR